MADTAWEKGKAYTAMLKKAADDAAGVAASAAAAVATAKAEVARATRALAAARTAAATWAAVEALVAAEAALAAATATYEAALAAAEIAAAILAGAIIGTLIGQGLRGIWTWAFEILFLVFRHPGAAGVYVPMSADEADAMLPDLFEVGTGQRMTRADFVRLGEPGESAWKYASSMARAYVNTVRAAATATNGEREDFLNNALPDLQTYLQELPSTILEFSHHLEVAGTKGGSAETEALGQRVTDTLNTLITKLDPSKPDFDEAKELCGTAISAMNQATAALGGVQSRPVVGTDGYIPEMTIAEFREFIAATASRGEAALPRAEIDLANTLIEVAGVEMQSDKSMGALLAEYDAGGDNSREQALFEPQGSLSLADYLRRTIVCHKQRGNWLDIDPETSELVHSVRDHHQGGVHLPVATIRLDDFDKMIGNFRTSIATRLKVGPNIAVEVPAKTALGIVADRHTGGDVSRLLSANPQMVVPVNTFRSFLSGEAASGGEIIAGARPLSSASALHAGGVAGDAGAALAVLLRAVGLAMTDNMSVNLTSGSPFASSTGVTGGPIVLLPPDRLQTGGQNVTGASTNTVDTSSGESEFGAEVLGNAIHGGLPS